MARKKAVPPPVTSPEEDRQPYLLENDAPWGGFINIRLDDAQKEEFFTWEAENAQHVPAYFDEMLGAGIKASISYDATNECYVVAVTGALVGSAPLSRFCSTSRGGSLAQVLALTVWKHVNLAKGDYGSYRPKGGTFMSFG